MNPPTLETGLIESALEIAGDLKPNQVDQAETKQNVEKSLAALFAAIPRARLLTIKMQMERDKATQTPEVSKQYETVIRYLSERADAKAEKIEERKVLATMVEMVRPTETAPPAPETTEGTKVKSPDTFFPHTIEVREWSPKQIAAVSAVTLGGAGLFALWQWWRHRKDKPAEGSTPKEKKSIWSKLLWIPVIGAGLYGLSKLSKMIEQYGPYKAVIDKLRAEANEMKTFMKEHMPMTTRKDKSENDEVKKSDAQKAEKEYRETRGVDLSKVRKTFGLKEGETSADYEAFLKDMAVKYGHEIINGITYERCDAALINYEDQMKICLDQFLQWIENNAVPLGIAAYALNRAGLLRIRDIIKGTETVAVKCAHVAKELAQFGLKHKLISLFTVGGTLFAIRFSSAAAKKLSLVANFQELGSAVSRNLPIAIGNLDEEMRKGLNIVASEAKNLGNVGSDYARWIADSVLDFGKELVNKAPEILTLSPQEVVSVRNTASLDNFRRWLERSRGQAVADTKKATSTGMIAAYDDALAALEEFQNAFSTERLTTMTGGVESVRLFAVLREKLQAIGVDIDVREGIAHWKFAGKHVDLCVDPAIVDAQKFSQLSDRMRQGEEWAVNYIFFRALQQLQQKLHIGMNRVEGSSWIPEGKAVAMIIGNMVYFTDLDNNHEQYWSAPIRLVADLFPNSGKTWTETGADAASASVQAGLFTFSLGAWARLKRAMIGGQLQAYSWKTNFRYINPITSPFAVLRDAARGIIDFEKFGRLGAFGEQGGRYVNTLLARAEIRPEWIGIVENSANMRELSDVAREIGGGHIETMTIEDARAALRTKMLRMMENVDSIVDVRQMTSGNALNYNLVWNRVNEWYQKRSQLSRVAQTLGEHLDRAAHPIRTVGSTVARAVLPGRPAAIPTAMRQMATRDAIAINNLLSDRNFAGLLKDLTDTEKESLIAALKTLDGDTLDLLRASPKGQSLIKAALKSPDPARELARMIKAAEAVGRLSRFGLTVIGVAGDAFGLWMAGCDWVANGKRITETSNPELKALYKESYTVPYVEGGLSATGLAISGATLVFGVEGTIGALAAGAGAIMMPVGMAVAAYRSTYTYLEHVRATSLETVGDLKRKGNEELLKEIAEQSGIQESEKATKEMMRPLVGPLETMRAKESDDRSKRYEAFFRNTATFGPLPDESPKTHEMRVNRFVRSEMLYIHRITKGLYTTVAADELDNARAYAELIEYKEQMGASIVETYTDGGRKIRIDLGRAGELIDAQSMKLHAETYRDITDAFGFDQLCIDCKGDAKTAERFIRFELRNPLLVYRSRLLRCHPSKVSAIDAIIRRALVQGLQNCVDALVEGWAHPERRKSLRLSYQEDMRGMRSTLAREDFNHIVFGADYHASTNSRQSFERKAA